MGYRQNNNKPQAHSYPFIGVAFSTFVLKIAAVDFVKSLAFVPLVNDSPIIKCVTLVMGII